MRPGELVSIRWDQFDLDQGTFHVNRAKNGIPSVHPISGVEIRALRKLKREQQDKPLCVPLRASGAAVGRWTAKDHWPGWQARWHPVLSASAHATSYRRVQVH